MTEIKKKKSLDWWLFMFGAFFALAGAAVYLIAGQMILFYLAMNCVLLIIISLQISSITEAK